MKIALLHYTFWPEFGGVENIVRDQALALIRHEHEVLVLTGSGSDPHDGYAFAALPELAYDYPLHVEVRKVLDSGMCDQNFNKYRALLVETLRPALAEVDLTIVHNIFTTHFNLALTAALHDLAKERRMIAWTHDLTATNTDYALPNPGKMPWAVVKAAPAGVPYVAVSELRKSEIEKHIKPTPPVTVIPDAIDLGRFFHLTPEMAESLEALALEERDYVFLTPARVMLRKNLDLAIELTKAIREKNLNPLLLITGAGETNSTAATEYGKYLRQSLPESLRRHVVFVNDFFPVKEETMRDLYSLSDCLLFPSRQEGFGLPLIEAGLHHLPVWCNDIPAYRAVRGEGAFLIDNAAKLDEALAWLESQATFRLHRIARRQYDSRHVYREHYVPFFHNLINNPTTPTQQ